MKGSVEERALAFEQEDDLGLGQEDGVSVECGLKLLGAERRVLAEKRLRSLTTVRSQTSSEDEAIHRVSLTSPACGLTVAARSTGRTSGMLEFISASVGVMTEMRTRYAVGRASAVSPG
jgi:hypothetical protein